MFHTRHVSSILGLLLAVSTMGVPYGVDAAGAVDPLISAVREGDIAKSRQLLDNGADPNVGDQRGMTPLMHAAGASRLELVELLLARGAKLNARDRDGDTALKHAAWNDDIFVMEALITKGPM